MVKEKLIDKRRKKLIYSFVFSEILYNLNKLTKQYKVDYEINAKDYYFILKLSNGDKMTYISLNILTIKEKIKSYLIKKYQIEFSNSDIELLKAEEEFSMLDYSEIEKYLKQEY